MYRYNHSSHRRVKTDRRRFRRRGFHTLEQPLFRLYDNYNNIRFVVVLVVALASISITPTRGVGGLYRPLYPHFPRSWHDRRNSYKIQLVNNRVMSLARMNALRRCVYTTVVFNVCIKKTKKNHHKKDQYLLKSSCSKQAISVNRNRLRRNAR